MRLILIVFINFLFLFSPLSNIHAQITDPGTTQEWTDRCADRSVDPDGIAKLQGFECIFRNILQIIIPLAGLAAFLILISGGFQYLTSGGDPKQAQKASATMTSAIIGIAAIVGVWFIFKFLNTFTGINLMNFTIPGT